MIYKYIARSYEVACVFTEFCHAKYESCYVRLIVHMIIASQSQEFASW